MEMRDWRNVAGVTLTDKLRNNVIRKHFGVEEDIVTKKEKRRLKLFEHVKKIDEIDEAYRLEDSEVLSGLYYHKVKKRLCCILAIMNKKTKKL